MTEMFYICAIWEPLVKQQNWKVASATEGLFLFYVILLIKFK